MTDELAFNDQNVTYDNSIIYYCKINLAGKNIEVESSNKHVLVIFKDYLSSFDQPDIVVRVSNDELKQAIQTFEFSCDLTSSEEKRIAIEYIDAESLLLLKKIADALIRFNILLMHGAAISVNGNGFIFTAPSGTGKTTHILNWKKSIPSIVIINGDKPFIDLNNMMIYGSPWCGKEGFNVNQQVKLSGIVHLNRGECNSIKRISFKEILPTILQQCYIPSTNRDTCRVLHLINKLKQVPCFKLFCNMDEISAIIAYNELLDTDYQ